MKIILKENVEISSDLSELLDEHRLASRQEIVTDTDEHFSFALYDNDKLVGGLTAKMRLGEFYIILLAVLEKYRGQGLGKRLMLTAEEKAKELNCRHMLLTTYSYQGPDFYPTVGFEELARISDFPSQDVDKVYFIKYLNKK